MDETTFIDMQENPEELPPLPPGTTNVSLLQDVILGGLESAGATPESVMTTFSTVPVLWPIPPRLHPLGQRWLQARVGDVGHNSGLLIDLHRACRTAVRRAGAQERVFSMLAEALSPKVRHPLIFSTTEPSQESADLFSLEFIIAAGDMRSRLRVQGNSVARYWSGKRYALSSLKLNERVSPGLQASWVTEQAFGSRGVVVYGNFDIFDRCHVWADKNMTKAEAGTLKLALAWLKLHQDKRLAYDFEQAVMGITPFVAEPAEPDYVALMYTHENLNFARDLWLLSDKDDHEAFKDFYEFLVPSYIDDDKFRQLFKTGMVLKQDFTDDIRMRIDAGMMNFSGWFLKTMRLYEQK